jgi:FkbM family methyltransferase
MDSIVSHGLLVPKSDAAVFERYAEFEGLPDLDVSKVAKSVALCPSFEVALDIGAHVGAVAIYLARKFERVIAFEAVPETFEYLQRNSEGITNLTALNVAVGPENSEVYLSHYRKHGQLSHVAGTVAEAKTERIGPIPARTIDGMDVGNVSFIKIDVEGYEAPVLEGAIETIRRCRPLILVEQNGNDALHYGRPRDEASALLESLGMHRHPNEPRMSKDRLFTF